MPNTKSATHKLHELVITRDFDAPASALWQAWTNPEYTKRWWGPKTFTCPAAEIDFRIGGKYHLCMRSSEGKDYWSTGTYKEIVPNKRIVCTDSFADPQGNVVPASYYGMSDDFPIEMHVTVTFTEKDGRTQMTLRHTGMPEGEQSDLATQGWNEQFDKLDELLKTMS